MSVLVSGKRVRVKAAKDVADSAARDGLDGASALPHPERHLKVLAAPDVHFFVVGSDLPEVLPVDGEEAASHGRGGDGCHGMSLAILLHGLGNVDPEVERDFKSVNKFKSLLTRNHGARRRLDVLGEVLRS